MQKDRILDGLRGRHMVAAGDVYDVEKSLGDLLIRVDLDGGNDWDAVLQGNFDPDELAAIAKGTRIRFEGDVSRATGFLGQPLVRVTVACFELKTRAPKR